MIKAKRYKRVISILLIIYIIGNSMLLVTNKFAGGGRWGVSMFVAMAKRFLDGGGLFYSDAETGFLTSPFYFPGGTFVAILVQLVFNHGIECIMILIASFMGIGTIFLLVYIAGENRKDYLVPALVIFPLFFNGFHSLRSYMAEMHPDMPVLLFGAGAAIVMDKIVKDESEKWYRYMLLVMLLVCAGVFKQNSVMIFLGLGIAILSAKALDSKKKFSLLLSVFVAGILVLLVIFGIDGCFEATVQVMARHGAVSKETFIGYICNSIKSNKVFVVLLIAFLLLFFTKNIELTFVQRIWLMAGMIWLMFNIYGAKKEGSNEGNVDAALIALAPFVGMVVQELYYKIKEHIKIDDCFWLQWKRRPILMAGVYMVLIVYMISWGVLTYSEIKWDKNQYIARKVNENAVTDWLNSNCRKGSLALYGHYYFWLNDADIDINTDFYTENAYAMADMVTDEELERLYNQYKWDVIIFNTNKYRTSPAEWTFANYELVEGEVISDIISMEVYRRTD